MEHIIKEFKPKEFPDDDEFWETYFEFTESNFRFHNPGDPLPNREGVIQRQKADIPNFLVKRWLVYTAEEKIVGWGGFGGILEGSDEYEANKHTAGFNIAVLPEYSRQGIGTSLLTLIVKEAQSLNRTVIDCGADCDSGRAFLQKYGGKVTLEGAENRLDMEDVDWDLMRSWVEEGEKRAEGVVIESFYECPEEIIDEYCQMYTKVMQMVPLGDVEYVPNITPKERRTAEKRTKDLGRTHYTMVTREKDGKLSGLTEVFYDTREGHEIHQELTGVLPEYRGRGLGKLMKAQMALHIKDTYPDVKIIVTGNADVNAPMLSINDRMGFKRHKGGEGYKFQTEELARKLGI